MKREEAQELAELDLSNIIATQGKYKFHHVRFLKIIYFP